MQNNVWCDQTPYKSAHDAYGNRLAQAPPSNFGHQAFLQLNPQKSPPYKRQTYFIERLTQWCQNEPPIKPKDLRAIRDCWHDRVARLWPAVYAGVPDKWHIRRILSYQDWLRTQSGKTPRFVRVYLEKWLTIRYHLSGTQSTGRNMRWVILQRLRSLFDEIQRPFDKVIGRFPGRRSMLNYNFLIRRFLDLMNLRHLATDFPPLKTLAKQRRLIEIWRAIIAELRWPYINNDAATFPQIKFYVPPATNKW